MLASQQAPCGTPLPVPLLLMVQAETVTVSSGAIQTLPTQDVGGGRKLVVNKGQTYDYPVNVTVAGSYQLVARLDSDPNTQGRECVHFESPAGANISGPLCIAPGAQWTSVDSTQTVALPMGTKTIRLVADSVATNGMSYINWFQLVPVSTPSTCTISGQLLTCPVN